MIAHDDIDDGQLHSKMHKAVSGHKRRYQKDGFSLDLVYLTPRIIVHGFPAAGLEHIYRNPRYEIKRFMDHYHKDNYKMYNFCCEPGRGYSPEVFYGRVERYPFKDHNTPPFETMAAFANSAKAWMDLDPAHVCNMHCKAGKGRAGLMSCVLLVRSGSVQSAEEAMKLYDRERVTNNKGLTVTSQRKFVMFYERLWREYWGVSGNIGDIPGEPADSSKWPVPEQATMRLKGVEIVNAPDKLLSNLRIKVFKGTNFSPELRFDSGKTRGDTTTFECDCDIQGNFKVGVEMTKFGLFGSKAVKVLELWHNTLFVEKDKPFVDFGTAELDIKKSYRKNNKIGDTTIRLMFEKTALAPSSSALDSDSVAVLGASTQVVAATDDNDELSVVTKGYEMVSVSDVDITATAV